MLDNTINDDKTIAGGIGTMLAGRYHILRQLGEGGMGSVWLAEDRQLDNRKVAIKMLPSIVVTDKRAYQLGTTRWRFWHCAAGRGPRAGERRIYK